MLCVVVGILFICVAARVVAVGVYRRFIKAGGTHGASLSLAVVSFIATFLVVFVLVVIFLGKFRLMR